MNKRPDSKRSCICEKASPNPRQKEECFQKNGWKNFSVFLGFYSGIPPSCVMTALYPRVVYAL